MTVVSEPTAPAARRLYAPRFAHALALFATGMTVTFTQDLHENLTFNSWVVAGFGAVLAVLLVVRARHDASGSLEGHTLARAAISLAAGVAAAVQASTGTGTIASLGAVLTVWASAMAVLELWQWLQGRSQESLVMGVLAATLAMILALAAKGLPAITGFFGAYCIIAGVYLGIAAFDNRPTEDGTTARESAQQS